MDSPHSIKRPLEGRVWYRYPGQTTSSNTIGSFGEPSRIARKLDDGTSQVWDRLYDTFGNLVSETDPLGRITTYTFAPNGADLLQVRQTKLAQNDLLASFSNYTAQRRPQTIVDAAGQTTTITYNTAGQPLTVTNPKLEVTTLVYDTDGQLTSLTGPVSGAAWAYTYDTYGRVRTVTDPDAYVTTTDYDLFDRRTRVTYPDATYDAWAYDRLDLATGRDRLGRTTRYFHDALRRLVATRDPLGRTVRQDWCSCGSLAKLTDAKGQTTTWERDGEGRVTRELRHDQTTATTYTYEALAGRLKTVTDPKAQVKTFNYRLDDQLASVTYTNASIATPSVTYNYDGVYPRLTSMVDGTGTTAYTYRTVGQLGAGSLGTVDGPAANDTFSYSYDELGRVTSRTLNSSSVTWAYDALGRLTSEANPLGTFTYGFDGVSGRPASATYPNGQTTTYSYLGASQDLRLGTIHHKAVGAATISKFDYTYDVVGNILTWQQQADASAPERWTYGYDAADQLIAAVRRATDVPQTVLKRYGYVYDTAGNRTTEQVDDAVMGATFSGLNRLVSQQASGTMQIAGQLNEPGSVTIDGQPAVVDASNRFVGKKSISAGTNAFTVTATDSSGNARSQIYDVDSTGTGRTLTYDANGNLTADGTRTFEWDAENRLVAVNIGTRRSEFTYDGLSRRTRIVEKENGASVRDAQLLWAGTTIVEERLTTGEVNRFFSHGEQNNGAARYLTRDHLGSIREVTDNSGAVVTRNEYDPYGRVTRVAGTADSRFGYTGHLNHTSSGLVLALYRAYDPALGRWLSADPAGMIDGPNVHAYVANNPARYMDPLGLEVGDWWDIVSNLQRAHQIGMQELAKRSGPGMHNNANDAMRHAEWMRRTADETNAFTAWLAGVGHELDNLTEGAPLEEILMDLHNNAQGRRAASEGRLVDPNSLQTIGGPDKPYNRPKPAPKGYDSYPKSAEGSCRR
jgi:RHS repeat-associated protein